jgi:hypothetical protein
MTWMSKAWGPMAGLVLDVEGVKVGLGGRVMMLKHRTKLVRGYLMPHIWTSDGSP